MCFSFNSLFISAKLEEEKEISKKPSLKQCSDAKYYDNNSEECDELKENLLINKYPKLVKRNQDLLILFAQNGKHIQFKNNNSYGEDSAKYTFEKYIPQINCSVTYYRGWEWGGYYIINHNTGQKLYSHSLPVISPRAIRFVFPDEFNSYEDIRPSVIIYKNTKKVFIKEFEYYFEDNWSPSQFRWLNDNEFKFIKEYGSETSCGISQVKGEFKKGIWYVFDDELCYLNTEPEYDRSTITND